MTGITHVNVESENRDHGQALGDVHVDRRLRNNAQRGHEKK